MSETDYRSLRILVDLQACQTAGSATRGVGRYSKSLFEAMSQIGAPRQLFGLIADGLHHRPAFANLHAARLIEVPRLPDWNTERDFRGGERDTLGAILRKADAAMVCPDVVHVSHVFEGFSDNVALPNPAGRPAGQVFSATLYDFIPLKFRDYYLKSPDFAAWYRHRLSYLHQADLLLSISEATRQDGIELLGLDPDKIVTIHGGIADHFKPQDDADIVRARLRATYRLNHDRFVLYTGGDDHRKNLIGAVEAYAALPSALRASRHLVVICAMEEHRKEFFRTAARDFGLSADEVRFLGFVPEDDLVGFYATCDVFFFPSLYEGLGLPVIEAMATGAPVICGNNSSLRELVDRRDALFDATSPASIARTLQNVLENDAFAADLRSTGLERAKKFNWNSSARLALDAFDEVLTKKRNAGTDAASRGWLPRLRLAMLTPLPPCRSGIADYNAKFLPYLSAHFDIDLYVDGYAVSDDELNAAFRIFDASEFSDRGSSYDAILYEFGNSEYHAHMLPLLAEHPGVVGLHDAFLSGLMAYLDIHMGKTGQYGQEMLYSHGGQARRVMAPVQGHPDPVGETVVRLPCSKSVIDGAIGIISHSPFNLTVARSSYPEGWLAPYRVVPQMVAVAERWDDARKRQARVELGLAPDDFVVVTLGHVAWTKWGDRLLEAFVEGNLAADDRCHLIFAGPLPGDDFGRKLSNDIRRAACRDRIKITGFLSEADYERLINAADLAVQLRTKSRGGTPKAVLDCLARGLPVLVNNDASYVDYPDDVVMKLSADPSVAEIATALKTIRGDRSALQKFAERGFAYVRERHDPKQCAAQYAAAIHEFVKRNAARNGSSYARELAPHLASLPDPMAAADVAALYLDRRELPNFSRPRLLIDVSHIAHDDHKTGIPRVVRETVRAALCNVRLGVEAVAVQRVNDKLFPASNWLKQQGLLLAHEANSEREQPISFRSGDHLLMLDSSWAAYGEFAPIFAAARASRVPITTAVYDLLPLMLPAEDVVKGGREWFERWIQQAIAESDNLICISKSVADDVIEYIKTKRLQKVGQRLGWWHLGSSPFKFADPPSGSPVRGVASPYALMVGTIEPRKNHALALDAFEQLWSRGSKLNLVVVGKSGWLADNVLRRLRTHPQLGRRLFFYEQATDAELQHLYRNAASLLMASKGEGFGLPVVEAAHYGTPVICSDIPAFRELAGQHAIYVRISTAAALSDDLERAWAQIQSGSAPRSSEICLLSWEESTEALLKSVLDEEWYWTQ